MVHFPVAILFVEFLFSGRVAKKRRRGSFERLYVTPFVFDDPGGGGGGCFEKGVKYYFFKVG